MAIWETLGNLTLIALILMVYSFPLYKENLFYRFVEYLFIGVTIGHATVVAVQFLQKNVLSPILGGETFLIGVLLLSALLFTRFYRPYAYLARWPMSFLIGSMMGLRIFASVNSAKRYMLATAYNPLAQPDLLSQLGSVFVIIGYITAALYFTWGWEHKGPLRWTDKIGRYLLMTYFGVSFGSIAMARFTWFSGTIKTLLTAMGLI